MKLEGTYTFNAPRDLVWESLLNPDILANVLPGCEKLEKIGDNEFKGALKMKVGPVQGLFHGKVTLTDLDAPKSYNLQIDGQGAPGFVKGNGEVYLKVEGDTTVMNYTGEAQVGGRIANVGQRLMDSSAKAITRQALESLNKQIMAQVAPSSVKNESEVTTSGSTVQDPSTPSQAQFAANVTKEILDDLVPFEQRPVIIVTATTVLGVILLFNLLSNWFANKVAYRVVEILEQRK